MFAFLERMRSPAARGLLFQQLVLMAVMLVLAAAESDPNVIDNTGSGEKKEKNWINTVVRVVIPLGIVYFYFVHQQEPGKPKETYYKHDMLLVRAAVRAADVPCPEELKTMRLITPEEAPHLFKQSKPAQPQTKRQAKKNAKQQEMARAEELENLVNFMAFSPLNKRVFLPREGESPPPPGGPGEPGEVSPEACHAANEEVQIILRGAHRFKQMDIGRELLTHLVDHGIAVEDATWKQLIELALVCEDGVAAKEFILKMEKSGNPPSAAIIDKVTKLIAKPKAGDLSNENTVEQVVPTPDDTGRA